MYKKICYIFIFIQSFLNAQVAPCFNPITAYSVVGQPTCIRSKDINADGNLDLLVTNFTADVVTTFTGSGIGTFGLTNTYTVGTNPFNLNISDFNNDGKIDMVVTNQGSSNISILLNAGAGVFSSAINYSVSGLPRDVVCDDFNGDGKLDLAIGYNSSNIISIMIGNGTGSFSAPVSYTTGGSGATIIVSDDFNGDGKRDLGVTNGTSNDVTIFIGTGTGSFLATSSYSVGNNPRSITSGDFNSDGNKDLAIANWYSYDVSVLLGSGVGTFTSNTFFTVNPGAPYSILTTDFNNDGILDLATTPNASVLMGIGNGSFTSVTNYTTSGGFCITSGDYDVNGMIDMIVTDNGGNNLIVFLNDLPNVGIVSSNSIICSGQSATLTATGAPSYTWNTSSINPTIIVSPTVNTTYSVIGTNTNNCMNSSSITLSVSICSGINETHNMEADLKIFPSPAKEKIEIVTKEKIKEVQIYDVTGKLIFKENSQSEIDISSFQPGLFLIRVYLQNGRVLVNKLIKE